MKSIKRFCEWLRLPPAGLLALQALCFAAAATVFHVGGGTPPFVYPFVGILPFYITLKSAYEDRSTAEKLALSFVSLFLVMLPILAALAFGGHVIKTLNVGYELLRNVMGFLCV
jgi:hypothetical protein